MILWMLLNFAIGQFLTIPILYSKYTSPVLTEYLKTVSGCLNPNDADCKVGLQFQIKVYKITDLSDLDTIFINSDNLVVYDASSSLGMSSQVNNYARNLGFLQCIIGYAPEKPLPYVYYSDYSYDAYAKAALSLAKNYKISRVIAIISSEFTEIDFHNDEGIEIVDQLIMSQASTYEYIFWLFSKKLKVLGIKWFFFKTNAEISKLIQKALVETDMNTEGYIYIYIQEAAWGAYLEGSILIEIGWWHSANFVNYINNLIYFGSTNVYNLLSANRAQGSYSGYILNKFLSQMINPDVMGFTIWNVQNGTVKAVGTINGAGVNILSPIVYPGGILYPPNSEKIKIPISINGASYNNDELNTINQLGFWFAIDKIKREEKLLSNFEIEVKNITDWNGTLVSNWVEDLGYFHISATETQSTLETVKDFKENNILTPVLGIETSSIMSGSEYYPQYARVSYPNSRTASAAAFTLSVFGISKCSLLFSDSQWGRDFSDQFISQADSYGLKILNKNRAVPLGFNSSDTKIIREIIDVKTRFVVIEVHQPDIFYIIEAFYDLGMRKGDIYLIIGDGVISVSDLDKKLIGSKSFNKRQEIMSGLIYISFLSFQNQIGYDLKREILSKYDYINDNMCLFYDAAYLGLYTIDALMNWGVNLNSSTIQDSVRKVAFAGCSGIVRISQEGNDRLSTILGIYNLIQVNSTWTMNLSGLYDPSQLIVLQIKNWISWNGNSKIPSGIIGDDQECPFRDILIQSFLYGYFLLIIIEIIPMIMGTFFAMKFYNLIFKQKYPQLIIIQKENFLDIFSYIIFLIEIIQYIQVGSDLSEFLPGLSNALKLTMLDIRKIFNNGLITFWTQVQIYEALAFFWFLLFLWNILKIGEKSDNFLLLSIKELNLYIMPVIGEILFLPINLYLFETFQCLRGIGDNYKDTFNDYDCSTFCWQGEHSKYAITSSLAILLYLPTSIHFRFTWKNDLPFHFQEQPSHIALKCTIQFLLICLFTVIKPASKIAFLGLCIGLLLFYLILSIMQKPLNYDRASLWYIILIASALLTWCCCALSMLNKLASLVLLVIGWILLIIAGVIYQKLKLPCLLKSEKDKNIVGLFRFQLLSISPEAAGIIKTNQLKYSYISKNSDHFEEESMKSSIQLFEVKNSQN